MIDPPGFDLLYEEGPCLVVGKPGGLLTQAPRHIDSLEARIKQFIKERDDKPGKVYLGVPHRLDRPVSGVMVFARHVRAARRLAEQFEGRLVKKTYWALVEGQVEPHVGTWRDYVRKIPDRPQAEIVDRTHPDARLAVLHYQLVHAADAYSLLEIELETGRMHQIRLQAASRGHAVVGDEQYGGTISFGPETDDYRQRWIGLHARSLDFRHPMTRERVSRTAVLPQWWEPFVSSLPE